MCSIIGYFGKEMIAPTLVKSLKRMEYRGYDSVGIAMNDDNKMLVRKGVGKVSEVNSNLRLESLPGNIGIGHTRWATHGEVNEKNAHPHLSNDSSISVVHNGIIENYVDLKKELEAKKFTFKSETDTEVIPNILQSNYELTKDVKRTIIDSLSQLKGHYAFVAMFENGTLVAAKNHEPLIIGIEKNGFFITSDVLGFIEKTDKAIYLENEQFVIINNEGMQIHDFKGNEVFLPITKIPEKFVAAKKGEYRHFTVKEIVEQSHTIPAAGTESEKEFEEFVSVLKNSKNVYITGSGTSYYASLMAKYLVPAYTGIKIESIMASEVKFSKHLLIPNSTLIAISQSGESADVLEAVSIAKSKDMKIISIVNVMQSSLVKESLASIGLNCGPEIGVAATKSFTAQLAIIYKIIDKLCDGDFAPDFNLASFSITKIVSDYQKIKNISKQLRFALNIFVLGRGIHYPIALEGALKLKELTYIPTEGIAAGELKHGPLAIIDSNSFVIVINPEGDAHKDNLSSIHEVKSRGAKIIGISNKPNESYDFWIEIPTMPDLLYPFVSVIPFQLLAYYTSLERGSDPDYPRNLAKSVTVL